MNAFSVVSKAEFLQFLQTRVNERYEYEGGLIVQQMTGGTRRHGEIAGRIYQALTRQLDRGRFVVTLDRGVDTPETVRFADVVVEPADEPDESLATARPVLIVEVLSPSTRSYDLRIKPLEYLALPSLDAYLIASQTEPAMRVWQRGPDGGFLDLPHEIEGRAASVAIACRGLTLSLDLGEIYAGLAGA
jgi:Uma2 family endonuclease